VAVRPLQGKAVYRAQSDLVWPGAIPRVVRAYRAEFAESFMTRCNSRSPAIAVWLKLKNLPANRPALVCACHDDEAQPPKYPLGGVHIACRRLSGDGTN
jgi:hypothetical protein